MLALWVAFAGCTLERGDNPYKILGIPKTATDDQVKAAYRKITMKHHPDISKTKESERIWIQATDAYELLKDPRKRQIYDQTGSVSDPMEESGSYGPDFGEDIFTHFFRTAQRSQFSFTTEEVNANDFDTKLAHQKELILFVYNGADIFSTSEFGIFFEQVAREFDGVTTFVRHNVHRQISLARRFGISSVPAFVFARQEENGNIRQEVSQNIHSREDLIHWIESCWEPRVKYIKKASALNKWLQSNSDFVRVVAFERGNYPSKEFMRASSLYTRCKFAVVIDDYVNVIRSQNLTRMPCTIVFRGESKLYVNSIEQLETLSHLVFAKLRRGFLNDVCWDVCALYCGKPSDSLISNFSSFTEVSTVWTSDDSKFAKALGLKEGQWALISGGTDRWSPFSIAQKYTAIGRFKATSTSGKVFNAADVDSSFMDMVDDAYAKVRIVKKQVAVILDVVRPLAGLLGLIALIVLSRWM